MAATVAATSMGVDPGRLTSSRSGIVVTPAAYDRPMGDDRPGGADERLAGDPRLVDLADRLHGVSDALDDLMFDLLRSARAGGSAGRPVADRTLVQARRAVDKAEHLLRRLAEDDSGPTI
jgi:hypothetical protein